MEIEETELNSTSTGGAHNSCLGYMVHGTLKIDVWDYNHV